MQTVLLKPLHHRGQEVIGIYFKNDADLNLRVRKLPSVKWSQTNKCWYVPLTEYSCHHTCEAFKEKAIVDSTALTTYLQKRKEIKRTIAVNQDKAISKA